MIFVIFLALVGVTGSQSVVHQKGFLFTFLVGEAFAIAESAIPAKANLWRVSSHASFTSFEIVVVSLDMPGSYVWMDNHRLVAYTEGSC
jgi:hypothetical protein